MTVDLNHSKIISGKLNIFAGQVGAVVKLLKDGATVPFISRYRKEATGSLDEVAIQGIRDQRYKIRSICRYRSSSG